MLISADQRFKEPSVMERGNLLVYTHSNPSFLLDLQSKVPGQCVFIPLCEVFTVYLL